MTRDVHNNASTQNQYEQVGRGASALVFPTNRDTATAATSNPTNDSIATLDSQQRATIGVDRSSLVADSSPVGPHSCTIPSPASYPPIGQPDSTG
jgi:hypothetical protein